MSRLPSFPRVTEFLSMASLAVMTSGCDALLPQSLENQSLTRDKVEAVYVMQSDELNRRDHALSLAYGPEYRDTCVALREAELPLDQKEDQWRAYKAGVQKEIAHAACLLDPDGDYECNFREDSNTTFVNGFHNSAQRQDSTLVVCDFEF